MASNFIRENGHLRIVRAIVLAGIAGGALDIVGAMIVYGPLLQTPATPQRILQSVASGLLGREQALSGGICSAGLGLAAHMTISLVAAAIYVFAGMRLPVLVNRPVTSGLLFGTAVYFFMTKVVVPFSAATVRDPGSVELFLIALGLNVFLFGLPISLVTRLVLGRSTREGI